MADYVVGSLAVMGLMFPMAISFMAWMIDDHTGGVNLGVKVLFVVLWVLSVGFLAGIGVYTNVHFGHHHEELMEWYVIAAVVSVIVSICVFFETYRE